VAIAGLGGLGINAMSATAAPAATTSTAPYCGIYWGSLPKANSTYTGSAITNVRTGRHPCFDRLVIDLNAARAPGYAVEYLDTVRAGGSGEVVPVRGGAKLRIIAHAPAYLPDYQVTYDPPNWSEAVNVTGYSTFRQVAWAGAYEGQSTIVLGVRARLPFRVFTLSDAASSRLVVDVAHYWS
jgi:hypothetical protein